MGRTLKATIMTPSEKSESLLTKFYSAHGANLPFQTSKECAIICVEQIINELNEALEITGSSYVREEIKHWNEVMEHLKSS